MIIKNVKVYLENETFAEGEIKVHKGKIERVISGAARGEGFLAQPGEEVVDGKGAYAIPGLIDLHFHGCMGDDFCDGTREAIRRIAEYEASIGVTAIAPATMTLPVEELVQILETAAEYREEAQPALAGEERSEAYRACADLIGVNMEGPFISKVKKGAQDERNILDCDTKVARRFLEASKGLVKFIGVAPEESENAVSFIKEMKDQVHISLAHTNANYEQAKAAFDAGASHAVHLYNAMPAFTHRAPGVVGAVADSPSVMAELICDGVHIHPAVVRATFQMMGADRMILISDSMRATGMPDGRYTLGGLDVDVRGNRATLVSDGALAGSATNLMDCIRTAVKKMGIPLETAVACATIHPAKSLGVEEERGSLAEGKKADIVLLDQELNLVNVWKDGVLIV
ncbi:N-acetylglucosamine-6-phosphate deacetylase [uncultured Merdimonas sp.]|uniref:N-acetylglucosamine-6-phosphate deacetylase n=1 Tax=uncultured Merdimonas sp. TaxID=2023269 RepID=UPI0032080F56